MTGQAGQKVDLFDTLADRTAKYDGTNIINAKL